MLRVVNNNEFQTEVINSNGVVLVDFFATWCGPCKMVAPVLETLSSEMEGKVTILKVDIDQSMELAQQYKIMSVPTMMVFKDGKPVETIMGFQPKESIKAKLEAHI
jgi:thioredoxin 1